METRPAVTFGSPTTVQVSAMQTGLSTNVRNYDVTPDGRVLAVAPGIDPVSGRNAVRVQVVLNWFEELKQRVPTK